MLIPCILSFLSAADLYISKHFDAFIRKGGRCSVLRVYQPDRRINTVPAVVKNYCLLSADGTYFEAPRREHILCYQVVITTLNMALQLARIPGLQGYFSHIFLDEAAQALECEAIMPMSLATENTCIVLAGDYMQINPKVYSAEAVKQNLQRSLLERLYNHYEAYQRHLDSSSPLTILLRINYRSKMEILRFISAIFYGGPDKLVSRSNLQSSLGIMPLTFYMAQGREMQDPDSTSYYNPAEIEETVDRVEELYDNWPEEWGERRADAIGVVTPYAEQVEKYDTPHKKQNQFYVAILY